MVPPVDKTEDQPSSLSSLSSSSKGDDTMMMITKKDQLLQHLQSKSQSSTSQQKTNDALVLPKQQDTQSMIHNKNNNNNKNSNNKSNNNTFIFPPKKKGPPSLFNVVLLYFTLIGLGAILGYMTFYNVSHHRCADLLDVVERRHQQSQKEYRDKYLSLVDEHQKCLEMDADHTNNHKLRERMREMGDDGGTAAMGKQHMKLMERHTESVERLATLQQIHEETIVKLHKVQDEVERKHSEWTHVKGEIESCHAEKRKLEQQWMDQQHSNTAVWNEKVDEIQRLRQETEACFATQKALEVEIKSLKRHLQNRQGAQCQNTYVWFLPPSFVVVVVAVVVIVVETRFSPVFLQPPEEMNNE